MPDAPYALALAAGLVAAANPCGFALLPAYLSLLVVGSGNQPLTGGRLAAVRRALILTAAMTLGFVTVFGLFGLLAAPAADAIARQLPWLSILIGLVLAILGGWLILGRSLPSFMPKFARGPAVTRTFGSMALFGAAYAIASLGCTIGPFLGVVVTAGFRGGSALAGVGLFIAYALGMSLVVGSVALAVALAQTAFVRGMRRATPILTRLGGVLLTLAGLYVAWYGYYELRVFDGDTTNDPIIDTASRLQTTLTSWLDTLDAAASIGIFITLLALTITTAIIVKNRYAQR